MSSGVTYVNSIGISSGGGLRLLETLFAQTLPQESYHFYIDDRIQRLPEISRNIKIERISGDKKTRMQLEKKIAQQVSEKDILFCFNNIPPLYRNRGKTVVYLQNRHILQPFIQQGLPIKEQLRLTLSWLIFKKNSNFVDKFFVQTPAMRSLFKNQKQVEVVPFLPEMTNERHQKPRPQKVEDFCFFYPSAPFVHKNHERLVGAWVALQDKGLKPKLILTLKLPDLNEKTQRLIQQHNPRIEFIGELSYHDTFKQYLQSDALIFPSLCESLGLPLLEAQHVGLPILSANRDYFFDTLSGVVGFDPLDVGAITL
jgi:glycosyltransferase involved in cell wall biosynthesis